MSADELDGPVAADLRDVVVTWNQTRTGYPRDATLSQLFEGQVDRAPHAIAVVDGDTRVSYRELDRRANQVAARLRALGVGPGALVGLCAARSAEMVVGMLGIVKAGGAYVPIDPSNPRPRLAMILDDASPVALVTYGDVTASLPPYAGPVVRLEDRLPDAPRSAVALDAGAAAYVIYTSGTTGRPKGSISPHRGVSRLVLDNNFIRIRASDAMLALSPLSFDAATFEIWGALLNGARLVVYRAARMDPREVVETIQREGVSVAFMTAALFDEFSLNHLPGLRGLRALLSGGDVLPVAAIERTLRDLPETTLINCYGPTEATVMATTFEFPRNWAGASAPIGRPIANTQVYILDDNRRPVAIGAAGEIYIGGDGVALGYLHLRELTAERFIENPFDPAAGCIYQTGDLARWRADGTIEFLGRRDQQVKLRGFRIELEEIENALAQDARIAHAVVVVREAAPGDKRLVAYCVPRGDALDVTAVKQRLAEQLPEYMVPSVIVPIARMPVTPHGKFDRAALPPVPWSQANRSHVEPRTAMEIRLAALWGELLNTHPIGCDDDFFALGGHSLLLGRLAARLRAQLGIETSLAALYRAPTLTAMAAHLERTGDAGDDGEVPPAPPPLIAERSDGRAPLSFSQERVWYFERVVPGNVAYQMQATLDFTGPLDAAVMAAALTELVRRHTILRTAFKELDTVPVQEVLPPYPVELPVVDLPGGSFEAFRARADELVAVETARPYDLESGRVARWMLFRHTPQRHLLLHAEHHLVHDGWSFAIFLDELKALYGAFRLGAPSPLPPPSLQFADFARWQRRWLTGDVLAAFVAHWKRQLTPLPRPLNLPTDRPHPPLFSFRGRVIREHFSSAEYARLRGAAKQHNVTLFTMMFSGFAALLARYAQQDEVVIGIGAANRRLADVERVLGMLINTLPLRVDLRGDPTFDQLLAQVHRTAIDAYAWQDVPLDRLVDALALPRDPSRTPLFSVMFSFHDAAVPDLTFGDLEARLHIEHNGSAKTDMNVVLIPRAEQRVGRAASQEDDSLLLIWEYATDLFDDATIRQMLDDYHRVLAAGIDVPDRPLSQLAIAPTTHAPQVMRGAQRPASAAADFAARVREAPEHIAVRHAAGELTYAELERVARAFPDRTLGAAAPQRGLDAVVAAIAAVLCTARARGDEPAALSDVVPALAGAALRDAGFAGPGDTVLQLAPCDSELFSLEVWSAVLSGATLQLVELGQPDGDSTSAIAAALSRCATAGARTSVVMTDARASALAARYGDCLRGVRSVLVMGPGPVRLHAWDEARVLHGAGTSEVPLALLALGAAESPGALRPIAGVDVVICDPRGTEVPAGVIGALRIFVASRAVDGAGRWRARKLQGGAVQLRGPAHEVGNVAGFDTDLYETRSVLAECADAVEAAVALHHGQIVAYVVPRSLEALRAFVASRLPAFQAPSRYIVLDALPLDHHGRVDLQAVAPATLEPHASEDALTATQARLVALCAGLLRSDAIDIRASFFLLGGHSLLAIRLVTLVNREFGIDLPAARFLRQPTIADLAIAVDEATRSSVRVATSRSARRNAAELLANLDQLSDAEVRELLNELGDA